MRTETRSWGSAWGAPLMRFTLTYDGPLPSSGNKRKLKSVWEIRKQFHPQLEDLWATHPGLLTAVGQGPFPLSGGTLISGHHANPRPLKSPWIPRPIAEGEVFETIDLSEAIEKFGRSYRPLVRESYALHCALKVIFLRREPPGRIYQGGDVDGRMKTLLDALSMPRNKEQAKTDKDTPNLVYCLMEDDSMISGLNIESERLLSGGDPDPHHVRLNIEVDVRVRMGTIYNQAFL